LSENAGSRSLIGEPFAEKLEAGSEGRMSAYALSYASVGIASSEVPPRLPEGCESVRV